MEIIVAVETQIDEQIASEIAEMISRQKEIDDRCFVLIDERDALGDPGSMSAENLAQFNSLSDRIQSSINAGVNLSQRIENLRSPGERERRVNTKLANINSIRRLRMSTTEQEKTRKPTPSDQGVPAQYLNEEGTAFRIGMDARLKSDLVNSALGLITKEEPGNSLAVFTEKEALALLEKRGWMSFHARKSEILAEKKSKAEAATAKREEQARERQAAKEAKDAEKAAAKEAKRLETEAANAAKAADKVAPGAAADAKASGSAAPDPKGGSKKK